MSAAFELAARFTMQEETGGDPDGGYNDVPVDPGGETKWGVSQRAYPHLDIKGLTKEQALHIYFTDYWRPAKCDLLPGPVAIAHFDCAFNSGAGQAARIFQRAFGAKQDGDLGPVSISSMNSFMGGRGVISGAVRIIEYRWRFLSDLVDEPEMPKERRALNFIEGWGVRCIRLAAFVSKV